MVIIILMAIGFVPGFYLIPEKYEKLNSKVQLICTSIMIFIMGAKLSARENFREEILSLGFKSLIFALIPIIFSTIIVFILTQRYMRGRGEK